MAREPFDIFIANHEKDEGFAQRLLTQIKGGLSTMGHVNLQTPADILAGSEIDRFIQNVLQQSQIIVLILSPDFMADAKNYWEPARDLHLDPKYNCRIFPILARKCFYHDLKLEEMPNTALLCESKTLSSWGNDDTPYFDIAFQLIELINQTEKKQIKKTRSPREQQKFAQLLTNLNYSEQPNQFLETQILSRGKFASNKAFAYLIKGKYGYGQDWLYRILRRKTKDAEIWEELEDREEVTFYDIPMSFSSLTISTDPKVIWNTLGNSNNLRINNFASQKEVVDHICNKLAKTQIVVFRFENFGELNKEMSRAFMSTFWQAIVDGSNTPSDDQPRFPIFMFLIDQNHIHPVCPDTFVHSSSEQWLPQRGVVLKELDNLSPEVVQDWFFSNRIKISKFDQDLLPTIVEPQKLQSLTEEILSDTDNGLPEKVLNKVSEKFNFRFLDILDQLAENE